MSATFETIDGIKCYAPELAFENHDYRQDTFEYLFQIEDNNFWFRARNRIIIGAFHKYLANSLAARVLEIGCGTGYVLKGLSELGQFQLVGADIYVEGLKYAQKRVPQAAFVQLDATRIPFENEFEAVGAFDTIEHIQEDVLVMQNINKSLKPGGFFFITVPQHPFMWSYMDDLALHKRRYTYKEMKQKLESAGFKVVFASSFVFTLFPLVLASRLLKRKTKDQDLMQAASAEFEISPILNKVFEAFTRIDEFLISKGLFLPFGSSLLVVAQKS